MTQVDNKVDIKVDISIVTPFLTRSLQAAIDYCLEHGTTVEITDQVIKATGEYICDLTGLSVQTIYFHEYFFQVQFALLYLDTRYNRVVYEDTVEYNEQLKAFRVVTKDRLKFFHRSRTGDPWYLSDIVMYCELSEKKFKHKPLCIPPMYLEKYSEYFRILLLSLS